MADRVVLSHEHLLLEEIDGRRRDTEAAIDAYFSIGNPSSAQRLFGFTPDEVRAEKRALLEELRRSSSMDLFGALEAAFRIDFVQRCHRRERDDISRAFKELYNRRGRYVALEGGILAVWRQRSDVPRGLITKLVDAFKYRHWLAHGRYWNPRFQRLDYDEIYTLAETTLATFPFKEG